MAGLGTTQTLADLAMMTEAADSPIVELLKKSTALLQDMAFRNGNQIDGHLFRVRAGLPGVTWRAINEGVEPTRASQKMVRETCAMLEAVSEVDKTLIDLEDNSGVARLEEAAAFIEAMGQEFAKTLWYGDNILNPRQFTGLAKRYNNLNGAAKDYIIDCGGEGNDNTSIWLIVHGTENFFGVVPKNGNVGLKHFRSGVIDLDDVDENGIHHGTYQGYRDRFQWQVGICLKDYRQVVRACNIDVTKLSTFGNSSDQSANLLEKINEMTNKVENLNAGRPVIYMNRTLKQAWEQQLLKSLYIERTMDQATGALTTSYKGIPIHIDDMILNTEERVQ